jgi:hypothetical protein
VGVACLLAVFVGAILASSGNNYPDSFIVTITNNTSNVVRLKECGITCQDIEDDFTIPASGTHSVNASPFNLDEFFEVFTQDGRKVGCLNLRYKKPEYGARVSVSSATECPG